MTLATRIKTDLTDMLDSHKDAVCAGVDSWDSYRYRIGQIAALRQALDAVKEIAAKEELSDDD